MNRPRARPICYLAHPEVCISDGGPGVFDIFLLGIIKETQDLAGRRMSVRFHFYF